MPFGEFEYGNYDSKKAKAMFNLPLGHTLGVRVAGLYLNRDGFTKNLYDDSRIDGRKLYSVRGTLSWEPDSDTRLDLIGYYFHEKDDRSRLQKQYCHRDPTGVLGCLPDRLGTDVVNGNSTLAAIQSSGEFLAAATGSPRSRGLRARQPVRPGCLRQRRPIPADARTVDIDYDPTYYAEEEQYQAKFFHDFGKVALNIIGGYAQATRWIRRPITPRPSKRSTVG